MHFTALKKKNNNKNKRTKPIHMVQSIKLLLIGQVSNFLRRLFDIAITALNFDITQPGFTVVQRIKVFSV